MAVGKALSVGEAVTDDECQWCHERVDDDEVHHSEEDASVEVAEGVSVGSPVSEAEGIDSEDE